jgi:hypothetical protein
MTAKRTRTLRPAAVGAALLLAVGVIALAQESGTVLGNSRLPLPVRGDRVAELTVENAVISDDNILTADNAKVVMLTHEGELECLLECPHIVIDQNTKVGHCTGHCVFERHPPHRRDADASAASQAGVIIEGDDAVWLGNASQLSLTNATVHIIRQGRSVSESWIKP